jgi:hypothetical protein
MKTIKNIIKWFSDFKRRRELKRKIKNLKKRDPFIYK